MSRSVSGAKISILGVNPTTDTLELTNGSADSGLFISSTGFVGVNTGTTDPQGDFEVRGNSTSGTSFYLNNTFDPSTDSNWRIQSDSNGDLNIGIQSSSFYKRLQFTPAGAVSIPNGILNIGNVDSGSVGIGLGANTLQENLKFTVIETLLFD